MIYKIENNRLKAEVSSLGAELQSIRFGGTEYLWQGDPAYWTDHSPVLFPYVGRFTDGKYFFQGKAYEMTIHGFAAASEFTLSGQTDTSVSLELTDSDRTRAVYPFRFLLRVTYALEGAELKTSYHVENRSEKTMYFGIGGHPGFRVPFEEGTSFGDYRLTFSRAHTPARVGHTAACFLSGIDTDFPLEDGRVLVLRHDLFDDDAVVLKNVADEVTLSSTKGTHSVTMSYPGLPYLGLWHAPKTEALYLCIEPWSSLPSRQDIIEDFQFKSDLIRLAPGADYENGWSARFS